MTSRLPASASIALCIGAVALLAACGSSAKTTASAGVSASAGVGAPAPSAATSSSTPATSGSRAAASGGSGTPNPCTLLTAAQVSAATGGTVGDGEESDGTPPLGGKKCNWSNTGAPVIDFEISLKTDADITAPGETAASLFDQSISTFPGLTAASGIGDKASFGKTQGYVLSGRYFIATLADIGGTADSSSINKTLTAMAVAKL